MIISLEQVKNAVAKWQGIQSDSAVILQDALERDINCAACEFNKISITLSALKYKADNDIMDEETVRLYICLDGIPSSLRTVRFGYLDSKLILNQQQIESLPDHTTFFEGGDITIPFLASEWKFFCFAVMRTELPKTKWQDLSNPLNKGDVSVGGNDWWNYPVVVGDWYFYVTNWASLYEGLGIVFSGVGDPPDPQPENTFLPYSLPFNLI